jgi:glycolate oxidase FAD binding subunit
MSIGEGCALPTSTGSDRTEDLAATVLTAVEGRRPLRIKGLDSKAFLGRQTDGAVLDLSGHAGVVAYEPSELVITARGGTRLSEIEALLADRGQILAFEPPNFAEGGTVGGMVAAGLSGPRRPFAGAVRDFVLGVRILDGRGQALRFGGTVFKNVAGFDAFRLMAGAMGCLGVLLDVSLRVAPRTEHETSVSFEEDWPPARARLASLMSAPAPLSGAYHDGERLHLRLSGAENAVNQMASQLGGEPSPAGFWDDVRHMRLPFLRAARLWRLSLPRTAELEPLPGDQHIDWAGGQRWLATSAPAEMIRSAACRAGGHATLFRGAEAGEEVFDPLPAPLFALHQRVKSALDPAGVFNPGRMYEGL